MAEEPAPPGWSTGPDHREAILILEDHSAVSVGCDSAARFGTGMSFHYAPFPNDLESGYVSWTRWGFFNVDGEPVLTGDQELIEDVTVEVAEALISSDLLILEIHAEKEPYPEAAHISSAEGHRWAGETEWRHLPLVYFHRVMFDLTTNRDVLVAVLSRCGFS
ncbi:MAG: hypothetical protein OXD34_16125 [bacterium]|nr:hypothetical protein [bacterium]